MNPSDPCFDALFTPVWSCLTAGAKISVVLDGMIWHEHVGLGKSVPGNQVIRLSGLVPPSALAASRLTVIGGVFRSYWAFFAPGRAFFTPVSGCRVSDGTVCTAWVSF